MLTEEEREKPLQIGYKKTCQCPDNKISCITAKEWVRSMVTIQPFYYESRDVRDKNVHPAVFPISLPTHFIKTLKSFDGFPNFFHNFVG